MLARLGTLAHSRKRTTHTRMHISGARGERIEHGTMREFPGKGMPIKGGPKHGKVSAFVCVCSCAPMFEVDIRLV